MTARELYGYALIAGIGIREAARMEPGFVMDMFGVRGRYDARMNGLKSARRYMMSAEI